MLLHRPPRLTSRGNIHAGKNTIMGEERLGRTERRRPGVGGKLRTFGQYYVGGRGGAAVCCFSPVCGGFDFYAIALGKFC